MLIHLNLFNKRKSAQKQVLFSINGNKDLLACKDINVDHHVCIHSTLTPILPRQSIKYIHVYHFFTKIFNANGRPCNKCIKNILFIDFDCAIDNFFLKL